MGNQHTNDIYKEYFPNKPANIKGMNDNLLKHDRITIPSILPIIETSDLRRANG